MQKNRRKSQHGVLFELKYLYYDPRSQMKYLLSNIFDKEPHKLAPLKLNQELKAYQNRKLSSQHEKLIKKHGQALLFYKENGSDFPILTNLKISSIYFRRRIFFFRGLIIVEERFKFVMTNLSKKNQPYFRPF